MQVYLSRRAMRLRKRLGYNERQDFNKGIEQLSKWDGNRFHLNVKPVYNHKGYYRLKLSSRSKIRIIFSKDEDGIQVVDIVKKNSRPVSRYNS